MKRLTKILFSFSIILIFNITISNQKVSADDNTSNNEIEHIYQQGKYEGILNDENMPHDNFVKLMNDSIISSYNNYKQNDNSINLNDYVKNDHYEIPYLNKDDHPTTVNAEGSPSFHMGDDNIHASDGYSMKAGDILIRYGDNPVWGKSTTPKALTKHEVNTHIVTPHGLTWNFIDSYSPTCIHKVIGE